VDRRGTLVIREAQMKIFRLQPRLQFERDMADYLKRYFPFEAANADLERWVRTGLAKAGQFGLTTRRQNALFLALTAILGAAFDEDPLIPWAAEIVSSPDGSAADRLSRVYDKGIEFLRAVGGPKCGWLVRAKLRVRRQDMTAAAAGMSRRSMAEKIRQVLAQMYPEKARQGGDKAMKKLVGLAIGRARERGAETPAAALIHATHMFYLGAGFDQDACYPWAGNTLDDQNAGPVDRRYERMHQLSLEYLNRSFQFTG